MRVALGKRKAETQELSICRPNPKQNSRFVNRQPFFF